LDNIRKQVQIKREQDEFLHNAAGIMQPEENTKVKRKLPGDTFLRNTEDYVPSQKLKNIFFNRKN